jgi:hypothetical protein
MTFYYRPSVVDGFASVEYNVTSVFGWLIRSIHRWSASDDNGANGFTSSRLLNRWI